MQLVVGSIHLHILDSSVSLSSLSCPLCFFSDLVACQPPPPAIVAAPPSVTHTRVGQPVIFRCEPDTEAAVYLTFFINGTECPGLSGVTTLSNDRWLARRLTRSLLLVEAKTSSIYPLHVVCKAGNPFTSTTIVNETTLYSKGALCYFVFLECSPTA